MLATYLSRFSNIADNKINCGPVLTWMEVSVYLFGDFFLTFCFCCTKTQVFDFNQELVQQHNSCANV